MGVGARSNLVYSNPRPCEEKGPGKIWRGGVCPAPLPPDSDGPVNASSFKIAPREDRAQNSTVVVRG